MTEDHILFVFLAFALGGAIYAYYAKRGEGILVLVGVPILVVAARFWLPQIPWPSQLGLLLGYATLVRLWCESADKIQLSSSEKATIRSCLGTDLLAIEYVQVLPDRVLCTGKFKTDRYGFIQQQLQSRLDGVYPGRFCVTLVQPLFQAPSCCLLPLQQSRPIDVGLSRFLAVVASVLLIPGNWIYSGCLLLILGAREWTRARLGAKLNLRRLWTMPGSLDFPIVGMARGTGMPAPHRRAYFWLGLGPAAVGLGLSLLLFIPGWLLAPPIAGEITLPTWLGQSLGPKLQGLSAWGRAGWDGLMITALGLLPVGFLEGGHLAHSLFGYSRGVLIGRITRVLFFVLCLSHYRLLLLPALLLLVVDVDRLPALNDLEELPESYDLLAIGMLGLGLLLLFPGRG